eukprot:TRINITY_DN121_c0_g1_i2.p1 TRINITY_DN121_c0_g1~~TRINITY_DN121_c0_g1_i2.p1  ORF type:complete len:283 (+),score=18.51 TRINITY_DN121_c0_g1_i2:569-1417(+)
MDFEDSGGIKTEKILAMKKFKRNRKTKKFVRYVVVPASAILLSWSSVWVPIVVHAAKAYFRFTCAIVVSPWFVFIMFNALIVTLMAKSGVLSSGGSNSASTDFYEEFVKSSENRPKYFVASSSGAIKDRPSDQEEEEKQCLSETMESEIKQVVTEELAITDSNAEFEKTDVVSTNRAKYGRSQSEKIERRKSGMRRAGTDVQSLQPQRAEEEMKENCEKDSRSVIAMSNREMSNDEFKNFLDDYIKRRHQDFRQETFKVKHKKNLRHQDAFSLVVQRNVINT